MRGFFWLYARANYFHPSLIFPIDRLTGSWQCHLNETLDGVGKMRKAIVWIETNHQTGNIKPYEVWFKCEGGKASHIASCATEQSAEKAKEKAIKRNREFYDISI